MRRVWPVTQQLRREASLQLQSRLQSGNAVPQLRLNLQHSRAQPGLLASRPSRLRQRSYASATAVSATSEDDSAPLPASLNEGPTVHSNSPAGKEDIFSAIENTIRLLETALGGGPSMGTVGSVKTLVLADEELDDLVVQVATALDSARTSEETQGSKHIDKTVAPLQKMYHEDPIFASIPARKLSSLERECAKMATVPIPASSDISSAERDFLLRLKPLAYSLSMNITNRLKRLVLQKEGGVQPDIDDLASKLGRTAQACYLSTFVDDPNANLVLQHTEENPAGSKPTTVNKRFKNHSKTSQKRTQEDKARGGYEAWLVANLRSALKSKSEGRSLLLLTDISDTLQRLAKLLLSSSPINKGYFSTMQTPDTTEDTAEPVRSHKSLRLMYSLLRNKLQNSALELSRMWIRLYRKETDQLPAEMVATTLDAISTLGLLEKGASGLAGSSSLWNAATFGLSEANDEARLGSTLSFVTNLAYDNFTKSIPALQDQLKRIVQTERWSALYELWDTTYVRIQTNQAVIAAGDKPQVLAEFLAAFVQCTVLNSRAGGDETSQAFQRLNQILSLIPKPTPLPVFHNLLAMYARAPGSFLPPVSLAPGALNPLGQVAGGPTAAQQTVEGMHATWKRMRAEGIVPDVKAYMLYMEGLGKKGDMQGLQNAWKEMHLDKECRRLTEEEDAKAGGKSRNFAYPPLPAFNQYMSILFSMPKSFDAARLAMSVFDYLCDPKSPYHPDLYTINTILRHLSRSGDLGGMMNLVQRLPALRLKPDVVTYTTLVKGLLEVDNREAARNVLDIMQEAGVEPTVLTYSLLLSDLCKTGRPDDMYAAEKMVAGMKRAKFNLNVVMWTTMISGYFRAGMLREGLTKLRNMSEHGIRPNRVTYNILLRSCVGASDEHMKQVGRTLRRTSSTSNGRNAPADSRVCMSIIQDMYDNNVQPDKDTWYIALNGMMRNENWAGAQAIFEEMERRKFSWKLNQSMERLVERLDRKDY